MPAVQRPAGVEIAWRERGEGPTVVFADQFFSTPDLYDGLLSDLATDHRVCRYDLRGVGESSRTGPYELESDVDDLIAVLREVGPVSVVIAVSDGTHRAVKALAREPDLGEFFVGPAGSPLARDSIETEEGLAGSASVIEALGQMIRTDYRAALRTVITTMNPQMDQEAVRERIDRTVAHAPQEQATARFDEWVKADAHAEALELGDRLWLLYNVDNPWFPGDMLEQTRAMLPDAHVVELDEGAISHPEHTAKVVRELSARRAEA